MAPQAKIWVLRCKNPFRNRIFELQTREIFRLRRYFFLRKKIAARSSISVPCELQISQHLVHLDVNHKSLCERPYQHHVHEDCGVAPLKLPVMISRPQHRRG